MNDDQQKGTTGDSSSGSSKGKKTKADFNIPYGIEEKYSDLIELILNTESMNDEERQYWFSIMPVMTDAQINRLEEILLEEKKKLEELDEKYEEELRQIAEKHFVQKTTKERKDNWDKIQLAKQKHKLEDEEALEDVLSELEDV